MLAGTSEGMLAGDQTSSTVRFTLETPSRNDQAPGENRGPHLPA